MKNQLQIDGEFFERIQLLEETPETVVEQLSLTVSELEAVRHLEFDFTKEEKEALESLTKAAMHREEARPPLPTFNVGIIGAEGHGKTSLALALSMAMGGSLLKSTSVDPDRHGPFPQVAGLLEYCTRTRRYLNYDYPTFTELLLHLITGVHQLDCAILVVNIDEGSRPRTRESILVSQQVGVPNIVVFLDVTNVDDPDIIELFEMEVLELLEKYDYGDSDVRVVRGSTKGALQGNPTDVKSIFDLAAVLDTFIPDPPIGLPFLMAVEAVASAGDKHVKVTGRIERGTLKAGEKLELAGFNPNILGVTVSAIEASHRSISEARAGFRVEVTLTGVEITDVRPYQVLAQPGSITTQSAFEAAIDLQQPLGDVHPQVYFLETGFLGNVKFPIKPTFFNPGDTRHTRIELEAEAPLFEGMRFRLFDKDKLLGTGVVTGF